MKRIVLMALATLFSYMQLDAMEINGTVKSLDGKALPGVVVSDGLNTAVTDSKGRFTIDADKSSRYIFISTPSGYISSTLEGEMLYYKEIKGNVESYDFIVQKNSADDTNHNLIVIADPQISDADEFPALLEHAKSMGEYIKKMDSDYTFGLCLGDIVGWNHALYPQYNEVMSHTGIEFRNVMGNHDMTNYGRAHETSMRDYEKMYGPAWYSFNVGKVHYIVINNNFYLF